jgi:synaptobrevin family protein YKT6
MHVLKWYEDNSLFITSVYELGFASWYQKPFVKEQLNFGARTAAKYMFLNLSRSKIG